jgi:hypothetical protein
VTPVTQGAAAGATDVRRLACNTSVMSISKYPSTSHVLASGLRTMCLVYYSTCSCQAFQLANFLRSNKVPPDRIHSQRAC